MVRAHTNLTSSKKNRFIGAIYSGKNVTAAAHQENIPLSTAYDLAKKYKQTGSTHALRRSGRPPTLSDRDERNVIQVARQNHHKSYSEVQSLIRPTVSETTVWCTLNKHGYGRRVTRKVPWLRPEHKRARLIWGRAMRSMKVKAWERIIWSDECYVYIGDTKGRVYVTRQPDEVLKEDCLVPSFKQSSLQVMIWGCIIKGEKRAISCVGVSKWQRRRNELYTVSGTNARGISERLLCSDSQEERIGQVPAKQCCFSCQQNHTSIARK